MWSRGEQPHSALSNRQVIESVKQGALLTKPAACSAEMYALMKGIYGNEILLLIIKRMLGP